MALEVTSCCPRKTRPSSPASGLEKKRRVNVRWRALAAGQLDDQNGALAFDLKVDPHTVTRRLRHGPLPIARTRQRFSFRSPTAIPVGHTVTATATSDGGDTSEFSYPKVVAAA